LSIEEPGPLKEVTNVLDEDAGPGFKFDEETEFGRGSFGVVQQWARGLVHRSILDASSCEYLVPST
jgi:hypothetical protein